MTIYHFGFTAIGAAFVIYVVAMFFVFNNSAQQDTQWEPIPFPQNDGSWEMQLPNGDTMKLGTDWEIHENVGEWDEMISAPTKYPNGLPPNTVVYGRNGEVIARGESVGYASGQIWLDTPPGMNGVDPVVNE